MFWQRCDRRKRGTGVSQPRNRNEHMAEVQKTTQSGELTQRFIEFVMMHAQNAALSSVKFQIQKPAKAK